MQLSDWLISNLKLTNHKASLGFSLKIESASEIHEDICLLLRKDELKVEKHQTFACKCLEIFLVLKLKFTFFYIKLD